jgi:hypothetical protein
MRLPLASQVNQSVSECFGEEGSGPEEQGRLLDERFAAQGRHQPLALFQDVPDQAERVRLVGLPRLVADQPQDDPGRHQPDGQHPAPESA